MAGRVLVLGSVNMDLVLSVERHPRPGETLSATALAYSPGGKGANQAVAAARMGAPTVFAGRLGDDAHTGPLRAFLGGEGIDLGRLVTEREAPTGVAIVTVAASGENTVVVVTGANRRVDGGECDGLAIERGDVLLCQFEIPLPAIGRFFTRGRRAGATTILNAAPALPCPPSLLGQADVLVVNQHELAVLGGVPANRTAARDIIAAAHAMRAFAGQRVVVTLGAAGIVAVDGEEAILMDGRRAAVVDTTGAGDCFTGVLAARLASGQRFAEALTWANVAASLAVGRPGAGPSMPTRADVEAALAADERTMG